MARGNESIYIFIVVLLFVYLVLVGQYESFLLPLAVILSLPIGVMGSFVMLRTFGLDNDIFAQVGLIMLVGLLGKNAILIVEFATQKHQQGLPILDAAIEGARVRFRPILMTSFAFIAGMIPPVSYTHLDVYKRQGEGREADRGHPVGVIAGGL